jgi:hypothetical protein
MRVTAAFLTLSHPELRSFWIFEDKWERVGRGSIQLDSGLRP